MQIKWHGEKLTKKQALFLCWQLWEWLAETGCAVKDDWPHWEWNKGKVKGMFNACPCCEYQRQQGKEGISCRSDCPLKTLWPKGCLHRLSPYAKWDHTLSTQSRKNHARAIADVAKKEYMKLQKERR